MKICLSFDDGREDQFSNAYHILKEYGLVGTFHVTTGFIDGTFNEQCFGNNRKAIAISNLQEMHMNGMEISSHGDKHKTDYNDFLVSIEKLKLWGINKERYGFSVPNSKYTEESLNLFESNLAGVLSYIRLGRHPKCYSLVNKIRFVLYEKFHFFRSFVFFNRNNVCIPNEKQTFFSLVIRKNTRVKDLIRFIQMYSSSEYLLVIMFHSIVDIPTNSWEWSKSDFISLCNFLSANKESLQTTTLEKIV